MAPLSRRSPKYLRGSMCSGSGLAPYLDTTLSTTPWEGAGSLAVP